MRLLIRLFLLLWVAAAASLSAPLGAHATLSTCQKCPEAVTHASVRPFDIIPCKGCPAVATH